MAWDFPFDEKGDLKRFYGKKDENYFESPATEFSKSTAQRSDIIKFFKRIEKSGNDRSLALLSAIFMEHEVDMLLGTFIPGYKKLLEKREYTFSMKLELLSALKLIPQRFITISNCIRGVRNDFAHSLEIDHFDDLPSKRIDEIRGVFHTVFPKEKIPKSTRRVFREMALFGFMNVRRYDSNIKYLMDMMHSEDFKEKLYKECRTRSQKAIQEEIIRDSY